MCRVVRERGIVVCVPVRPRFVSGTKRSVAHSARVATNTLSGAFIDRVDAERLLSAFSCHRSIHYPTPHSSMGLLFSSVSLLFQPTTYTLECLITTLLFITHHHSSFVSVKLSFHSLCVNDRPLGEERSRFSLLVLLSRYYSPYQL